MNNNVPLSIAAVAALVLAIIAGGAAYFSQQGTISGLEDDKVALENDKGALEGQVEDLAAITAFGGGVNEKSMPTLDMGVSHVMDEVFSFSTEFAMCRVDTNFTDFVMPTNALGELPIDAHTFYMAMASNSVDSYEISTNADGSTQIVLQGTLDCFTEVDLTENALVPDEFKAVHGSRVAGEPAGYRVTAVDGGMGGGGAGDSFEFTTFFDPETAPFNHAVFGPEFTFTGTMTSGEITIKDIEVGGME